MNTPVIIRKLSMSTVFRYLRLDDVSLCDVWRFRYLRAGARWCVKWKLGGAYRLLFITAILAACAWGQALPPASSPGVANPLVTQENLQSTVCVANWTKTVRPPTPFTNRLKAEQMAAQGLTGKALDYEEDHRWPIEDGGNPTDPKNLWPQLWPEARLKDRLETYEHRQLCSGKITLADVGAIFTGDWWQEYDRLAPTEKWPPRTAAPAPKGN